MPNNIKYANPESVYQLIDNLLSLPEKGRLEYLIKLEIDFIVRIITKDCPKIQYERGIKLADIINTLSEDELTQFYLSEFGNKLLDLIILDGDDLAYILRHIEKRHYSVSEEKDEKNGNPNKIKTKEFEGKELNALSAFLLTEAGITLVKRKISNKRVEQLVYILMFLPLPSPSQLAHKVNFLSNLGIDFLAEIITNIEQFKRVLHEGLGLTAWSPDQRAQFLLSEVGKTLLVKLLDRSRIATDDRTFSKITAFGSYILEICPEFDSDSLYCLRQPKPDRPLPGCDYYDLLAEKLSNREKDPSFQTLLKEEKEMEISLNDKANNCPCMDTMNIITVKPPEELPLLEQEQVNQPTI